MRVARPGAPLRSLAQTPDRRGDETGRDPTARDATARARVRLAWARDPTPLGEKPHRQVFWCARGSYTSRCRCFTSRILIADGRWATRTQGHTCQQHTRQTRLQSWQRVNSLLINDPITLWAMALRDNAHGRWRVE